MSCKMRNDFNDPDRRALRIDPLGVFKTEIVFTPEIRKILADAANADCPVCLARGLHETADGRWRMCGCLDREC